MSNSKNSDILNRKLKKAIPEESDEQPFSSNLDRNEERLRSIFRHCADVEFRKIETTALMCLVAYIDNLVDKDLLDEHVIRPLQAVSQTGEDACELMNRTISIGSAACSSAVSDIVFHLLEGHAAILVSGSEQAVTVCITGGPRRSIEEPSSEPVIRGAKDGFVEGLPTNLSLIRHRLKTSKLKIEYITLGKLTRTRVAIVYLEGIAPESVVEEVRNRVTPIRLTGVIDSAYIEECIEDERFSPFPQIQSTERPDVVSAELLEGRVAILVDCSPFALIVPMTFWSGLQASEDYYIRWPIATFIRWVRFLFVILAIFAPSMYVAVTTYHQEMIPTNLVLSIAGSREGVPFPAMMEALIMELAFEALREAGIRLPKQIGQAVSIVGGLVIGQAAVQAGFISAPVVIIVSITGIAAFTIPRYSFANGIRILRFPLLFLAGALGLYGVVLGFLVILTHVTSMRSFGMLYFSPIAPFKFAALKDILIRIPIWASSRMKTTLQQGEGER